MFKHGWKLVLLILIASFAFIWLIKAPVMSSYLTKTMGIRVTLRTMSIWPKETMIHHFGIANPAGFKRRQALQIQDIQIRYRWKAFFATPREIDLINLENITLNIEIPTALGNQNNWSELGARMPPKKTKREVVIHKLVLKNMTVETSGTGAQILGVAGTQHFDRMEFDEIDSRDGFPTKELIRRIFEGAGLRKYIENFLNPTDRIKDTLNPFNIFGQKEAPEKTLEGGITD